ncbi:DUF6283 family protein [Nocardia sp. NPDC055029]
MGSPAPRPCASCLNRRDVPSGVWEFGEYEKLVLTTMTCSRASGDQGWTIGAKSDGVYPPCSEDRTGWQMMIRES